MSRELLDAILANPDDDDVRLVYADWCEDEGDDARAQLIRAQVERARLPMWDARHITLQLEEEQCIGEHGARWIAEHEPIEGITWTGFERGFPAHIEADSFEALAKGRDALVRLPVSRVRTPWPENETVALTMGAIPSIRAVRLDRAVRGLEPHWFAQSPLASGLTELTLIEDYADDAGLRVLFGAMPLLETLEMERDFGPDECHALMFAELEHLQSLTARNIEDVTSFYRDPGGPDAATIELLADWPRLSQLRHLNLSAHRVSADDFAPLFRSPNFQVRSLQLDQIEAQPNRMPWRHANLQLDTLSLRLNRFRGVDAMLTTMRGLRVLDLHYSSFVNVSDLASVLRCVASSIEVLDLRCDAYEGTLEGDATDAELRALEALLNVECPLLHTLRLKIETLPRRTAHTFEEWLSSSPVRSLEVNGSEQTALPLALAAKNPPSLECLVLWNVTESAQEQLRHSALGKRLTERGGLRFPTGWPAILGPL